MEKIYNLFSFLIFHIIIKYYICINYCGIGQSIYNVTTPPISNNNIKTNLESGNVRPIKIYIEASSIEQYKNLGVISQTTSNLIYQALNNVVNYLEKLIKVKPLSYTISIRNSDLSSWGFQNVQDELKENNGVDKDLIIFLKMHSSSISLYEATSEQKYIDAETKRPIVGIISLNTNTNYEVEKGIQYLKIILLHQFTHILGFYYKSFPNFIYANGNISKVIINTTSDKRSKVKRTYIHSPKVMEYAIKYYNCSDIIGVDLEDQDGYTNSHWDARVLLGEYMNSEPYHPEQVISEFTLALLEDSGWYTINYYTGGLMRYGKHKGCNFLNKDCDSPSEFKNEFFNNGENSATPSCSSGRLSRTYCHYFEGAENLQYHGFNNYFRLGGHFGVQNADFCLAFNIKEDEKNTYGNYVGNCKLGNGSYGSFIVYGDNSQHQNFQLPQLLGEKYDTNSFCVLSSVSINGTNEFYKFDNKIIHPMCYPMFCSEKSLTIKIHEQYVVCPRSGGKVQVNGTYEGFLFCPDYNLICTGIEICNDIFDCIDKNSTYKEDTYDYDYEILTNQIKSDLINELTIIGYELTENGKCPQFCEQCKDIKKCIKCKSNYNLIGFIEDDDKPIICNDTIDVSKGYYQNSISKVYYKCTEFCDKCNKTHCIKCDNIHKLNENHKSCIDKVAFCEEYDEVFNCKICKTNYAFIKDNRNECFTIDQSRYYTIDEGKSYFPCNNSINHCDICNNDPSKCAKCEKNYYFIEPNKTFCFNDKDLSEYFSENNNLSYYPCDTNIKNCQKCSSRYLCTICKNNLYLLIKNGERSCSSTVNDSYYTDDQGKTYHLCNDAMKNCEKCSGKNLCTKCFDNYGFFETYKNICVYLGDNRYYTDDGSTYYHCNRSIPFCEKCTNKNHCLNCIKDYYFIEYQRDKCYNDKNLSKYYTSDNSISYFLCENNCDTCYNKSECKTCLSNYYFIGDNRNMCYKIDLEKYYSLNGDISYILCSDTMEHCEKCKLPNYCDECELNYYMVNKTYNKCYNIDKKKYFFDDETNSYYPCNLNINHCDECFNSNTCNKCFSPYTLLLESPTKCYNESFYINDKTYFKLNDSFYDKCSNSMKNCKICSSQNYCEECDNNYYFLNNNHSLCVLESDITPKDEYFKVDNNYYSCSYKEESIENCQKCTNGTICIKCKNEYSFVGNNFKQCISLKDLTKNYYQNEDGIFFPCIPNCDICNNSDTCIECSPNYIDIYDKTQCMLFEFEILNVEKGLEENNENNEYITNYINNNKNKINNIVHIVNDIDNYTITIFQIWEGTKPLFEKSYYFINTNELTIQISRKFNIDKSNIIYCFINKYYSNYLEIYNKETGEKIDLNNECPECINTGFNIKNNYTNEIRNDLGNTVYEKIMQNNIDIFGKSDSYINDICSNLNIAKIDLSIKNRRKYFNLGYYEKEIICTDKNCDIISKENINFTGTCHCKINTDYNTFKNNQINLLNTTDEIKSYDISLIIFKCFKTGFNKSIISNTGFYLFLFFIVFQICFFILFLLLGTKKTFSSKKKSIANPPFKSRNGCLFIENFNIFEDTTNIKNFENSPKQIQEKDEADENFVETYYDENISENINDKNSQNTKLEEIIETNREGKRNSFKYNINTNNKAQNTKDDLLDKNEDEDKISKNELITKKQYYNKINLKYNLKSNENLRDFLSLNRSKNLNRNKNKNKKKKMSESFYLNTEGNKYNKTMNYKISEKISKLIDERRIKTQSNKNSEYNMKTREQLIKLKEDISSIKRSIIESPYNLNNKLENFSFCGFYWFLLGLKQPILNLSSDIKLFQITESFIPSTIKGIRFIFMLALNMFINSLLLSQKYYTNKFNYFDEKYNLRYTNIGGDIPTNERFSYAFKNTAINALICFLICFVIQSILNYLYFNIRNRINEIIINNKNYDEEIIEFFGTVMLKYRFMFMINMILMMIFFCYLVNFSAVYIGGDLDYISASILTFIFLQVFPFFICLILTLIRYLGLKISSEKIYKISQIFAY